MKKVKEEKPVLAICYDFDKTLSPDDMQAQGYIQDVYGEEVAKFWAESNELARANEMDGNLAYMYMMAQMAEGKVVFTRETLAAYGAKVLLFPGVETWFERMKQYGEAHGVIVEHYIISSGLKEMIEGTSVAKNGAFERIYASSFYYNERGVAKWPAQAVNYTNKTQFLFRIEKGVLDVNDSSVNDYFAPEDIRVPFRNMVYIGDSDTDIPCMKLVNSYGGHAIGVYNPDTCDKTKVYKMMRENRIRYFAPADYQTDSELDVLVKAIIDRTAANEKLEARYIENKKETSELDKQRGEEERRREELIVSLEESTGFVRTHAIISKLSKCVAWTKEQRERLYTIAIHNSQVRYILSDRDVCAFYEHLLAKEECLSDNAAKVREALDEKKFA